MKIISLNLAGRKDFETRLDKVVAFLNMEAADVICLQEVTFDENNNLAQIINSKLAHPYDFVRADLAEEYIKDGKTLTDGLAILSRQEIVTAQLLTLTPVPTDERGRPDFHKRIAQVLKLNNGINIVNTHLASNNNSYLQLRELINLAPKNSLLAGDFNMPKEKMLAEKENWNSRYNCLIDFCDYVSFPTEGQTFDYVFVPKNMNFVEVRVVDGLSDHNALVCEITTF